MSFQLTQKEAESLVRLARRAVEEYLKTGMCINVPENASEKLLQPYGVFVTISKMEDGEKELRGCIGYPYPTAPLLQAVIESAINAATQDPRFFKVSLEELEKVVFEVSVLTSPKIVEAKNPKEYCKRISVGEDGLIVERGMYRGLLLPQVPVEWKWNEEEFLCQCCVKAGLPPDSWLIEGTKVYKFSCIIAEELCPNGPVKLIDMRRKEQSRR